MKTLTKLRIKGRCAHQRGNQNFGEMERFSRNRKNYGAEYRCQFLFSWKLRATRYVNWSTRYQYPKKLHQLLWEHLTYEKNVIIGQNLPTNESNFLHVTSYETATAKTTKHWDNFRLYTIYTTGYFQYTPLRKRSEGHLTPEIETFKTDILK